MSNTHYNHHPFSISIKSSRDGKNLDNNNVSVGDVSFMLPILIQFHAWICTILFRWNFFFRRNKRTEKGKKHALPKMETDNARHIGATPRGFLLIRRLYMNHSTTSPFQKKHDNIFKKVAYAFTFPAQMNPNWRKCEIKFPPLICYNVNFRWLISLFDCKTQSYCANKSQFSFLNGICNFVPLWSLACLK